MAASAFTKTNAKRTSRTLMSVENIAGTDFPNSKFTPCFNGIPTSQSIVASKIELTQKVSADESNGLQQDADTLTSMSSSFVSPISDFMIGIIDETTRFNEETDLEFDEILYEKKMIENGTSGTANSAIMNHSSTIILGSAAMIPSAGAGKAAVKLFKG